MEKLYVDGGVIQVNPSNIGGTWAYRVVDESNHVVTSDSGLLLPSILKLESITNNVAEMAALVKGLRALPRDWIGCVYSDSAVTIGRAFRGYKWSNVPDWLRKALMTEISRLINWPKIKYELVKGHPKKAELAVGYAEDGRLVSEHQVWCDKTCTSTGSAYVVKLRQDGLL